MRLALLLLPLLVACSGGVAAPVDGARYQVRLDLLEGSCGPQPSSTVTFRTVGQETLLEGVGAPCRLRPSGDALAGYCPSQRGDMTVMVLGLGSTIDGWVRLDFPGSCSGRYALTGERL